MIRPVSIALVYGGHRSYAYAKTMEELIVKRCNQLPLVPLLVDGSNRNGGVMDAIETVFNPSNRAFIFISEVYEGKEIVGTKTGLKMTTPNLMFELGYLYKKMGPAQIKLITDFPFEDTKDKFCFPSDLNGQFLCTKPELKLASENGIKYFLDEILSAEITSIKQVEQLSEYKDISYNYIPHINSLFARELSENINGYSLENQYETIFNTWKQELSEFSHMHNIYPSVTENYTLMYLYERLLFVPAFHGIDLDKIDIDALKIPRYLLTQCAEAKLYNNILDYICGHSRSTSVSFYTDQIRRFEKYNNEDIRFGLSRILISNYLGLSYLNYAEKESKANFSSIEDALRNAISCFNMVISKAQNLYEGTLIETMLLSYAYFNRARARSALGLDLNVWTADFETAERNRRSLARKQEFPLIMQLYFKNEMYHSINGQVYATMEWHKKKDSTLSNEVKQEFRSKEQAVLLELQKFEQTIIAGQPFFEAVRTNAQNNLSLLF